MEMNGGVDVDLVLITGRSAFEFHGRHGLASASCVADLQKCTGIECRRCMHTSPTRNLF